MRGRRKVVVFAIQRPVSVLSPHRLRARHGQDGEVRVAFVFSADDHKLVNALNGAGVTVMVPTRTVA